MKKQLALVGAIATVTFAAAPAHALFFGGVFDSIAKKATSVVNSAAAAAKTATSKVVQAGAGLAHQAVNAARSAADNAVDQLGKAAKDLAAKGQAEASKAMHHAADYLKQNLPKSAAKYIDQGVKLGDGGLGKLNSMINTNIDRAVAYGHKQVVGKLAGKGHEIVTAAAKDLKGSVNKAIDHGRGILNGKIKEGKGRVTAFFNGKANQIVSNVNKLIAPANLKVVKTPVKAAPAKAAPAKAAPNASVKKALDANAAKAAKAKEAAAAKKAGSKAPIAK